jgi:hypothetical protein
LPSTPGVLLPLFSVTRFTANILPLYERVSSRCKACTLPHLPSRVALAIRTWSRCTCDSIWPQDSGQTDSKFEDAPVPAAACAWGVSTTICSLSRQMIFLSVFAPLQGGLRSFHIPLPAAPTACCTANLPDSAVLRAYPVPHGFPNGSGSSILPAAPHPRGAIGKSPCLAAYLLVQACQHLWLGYYYDVYMRFTCVSRTRSSLAPLHLDASRLGLASRFDLTRISAVTLSPELQTQLLPAKPVWVGNEWWNNRFRQALTCGTEIHATFRSHYQCSIGYLFWSGVFRDRRT